jgi:hypothetical protein
MSQGDRISQGGKGTNYPYQSKVLKGLQQSIDELEVINTNTVGAVRRAGVIRPTAAGDVNFYAAQFYSVSVANTGLANGAVLGTEIIRPGEILNFSADSLNNYFTSFAYDATGTDFLITFVY